MQIPGGRRRLLQAAAGLCCSPAAALAQTLTAASPTPLSPPPLLVLTSGVDQLLLDGPHFALRQAVRTGPLAALPPRFWPDGRHALLASADGRLLRLDLVQGQVVAERRTGTRLAATAVSSDGRWVLAGHAEPATLVLLDAALNPVKTLAAASRDGRQHSPVASVADAPARQSFIVGLHDIAELWEISYNPRAEDFYDGLVHDFRFGEGVPTRGFHNPRRMGLPAPMGGLLADALGMQAVGVPPAGSPNADLAAQVVNLDVRRRVATLGIAGRPQPDGAVAFGAAGRLLLAVPNAQRAVVSLVDLADGRLLREIDIAGPSRRLAGHPSSPLLLAAGLPGQPGSDTLSVVDTRSQRTMARLREPGGVLLQAEFSHDGGHLLACLAQRDGAVLVREASSLAQTHRLPMPDPTGVWRGPWPHPAAAHHAGA